MVSAHSTASTLRPGRPGLRVALHLWDRNEPLGLPKLPPSWCWPLPAYAGSLVRTWHGISSHSHQSSRNAAQKTWLSQQSTLPATITGSALHGGKATEEPRNDTTQGSGP
ncbi:hypothetical protein LIA77_01489 [Sarocladium implicatum]|nr:hypothetical protein LIA77_01489 [Sarocladium implicatum]